MTSTIDPKEIEKFTNLSHEWWNEEGALKTLHQFNPIRIEYILNKIKNHFSLKNATDSPNLLNNLNLLDIGCGGGLFSEPMKKSGATVTAVDASDKNITVAKTHAQIEGLEINYLNTQIENIAEEYNKFFDIIVCLEVIEHVKNPSDFIKICTDLLKDNGILFISTINRTIKSLLFAKIGAEYILRIIPIGTHAHNKFIKPSELNKMLDGTNFRIAHASGVKFIPFLGKCSLTDNLAVNYIVSIANKI